MPIQIKIKSSGADISEYDAPAQKQEQQITKENPTEKDKEVTKDNTSDAKETSETKSDKDGDSTDKAQEWFLVFSVYISFIYFP